jgi:GNAT superfamily N-acetyltransferase
MAPECTIRLATVLDIAAIRALWRGFVTDFAPDYPTDVLAGIDEFTRSCASVLVAMPPQTFVFLADDAHGQPIGFLVYEIQHRAFGQPARYAFVHYCYVTAPYRETGVAAALIGHAGPHLLAQGVEHVELTHGLEETIWDRWGCIRYEVRTHLPIVTGLANIAERRASAANPSSPARRSAASRLSGRRGNPDR